MITKFYLSDPAISCSYQYDNGTFIIVDGKIKHIDPRDSPKYTRTQAEGIHKYYNFTGGGPPTVSIVCPFRHLDLLRDYFLVNISIGDNGRFSTDLCYEHVDEPISVVVCSQPHFGIKNPKTARFWYGSDPPYKVHSLVDTFILYHTKLMGAHVVFQSLSDEFSPALEYYRSAGNVFYRFGWTLESLGGFDTDDPEHGFAVYNYLFQDLAETTCVWENRFRAKLFAVAYGVDNYAMPLEFGQTLAGIAEKVNLKEWSAIEVPFVEGSTPKASLNDQNVLKRWSLLGNINREVGFTPLGDPRCASYTLVHTVSGHLPCFRKYATANESLQHFKFHSVHLLALARPRLDTHRGNGNDWYSELASRLEVLVQSKRLENIFFVELHKPNNEKSASMVERYVSCMFRELAFDFR